MKRVAMLALVVTVASCAEGNAPDGGVLTGYTVSGTVTGAGKDNATLTLQGTGSPRTATSNATGGYQFLNVPTGDYTLTVSKKGFAYTPPSQTVKVASKDFAVPAISSVVDLGAYAVSGTISGDVKSSIQVKLVGNGKTLSATTNSSGAFSIAGATAGTYTLTPSLTGYSFSPASRTVTVAGAAVTGQDFGGLTLGWSTRSPAGAIAVWNDSAMSSDVKYRAAVAGSGRLFTSSDYGVTWQARNPEGTNTNPNWTSVALSSDGKYLAATILNGMAYTSSNFGDTWKYMDLGPLGSTTLKKIAISNDGKYFAALDESKSVFMSSNSGDAWANKSSTINSPGLLWASITMSGDGSKVAASGLNGVVYISIDSGASWQNKSIPNINKKSAGTYVSWSGDGTMLVAIINGGLLYVSKDNGTNWQEKSSGLIPANMGWRSVAVSKDGTFMAAVVYGGGVYMSSDSGDSWKLISSGVAGGNIKWISVAISEDGRFLSAAEEYGLIYSYAAP